jgi:hypothetical protein
LISFLAFIAGVCLALFAVFGRNGVIAGAFICIIPAIAWLNALKT